MAAAVENFKDDDHASGRFFCKKIPPSCLGGVGLLSGKVEQGQEEEVDGHAGQVVLELGSLAHVLGIAQGNGRIAKETGCYTCQGVEVVLADKNQTKNNDETGPHKGPGHISAADMPGRIA